MQSVIPVDIHCGKLVDWLIQRRHCRRDWGERLAVVRKKIRAAIVDMPPNEEIKLLLTGSRIDYHRCKSIVDILKTTEASTKNIFGYYSSQRMKDWQEIVNLYEMDCLYLAEWSSNLIREVSYEVPSLRRNLAKLRKDKEVAEREKAIFQKQSQNFTNECARIAQTYGIKGINVSAELHEQLKVLPELFQDLLDRTVNLNPAVEFYVSFARLTSKKDLAFVPLLMTIINKGNITVFENRFGQAPISIEAPITGEAKSTSSGSDGQQLDDDIDFGDDIASSESSSGFVHVDKNDAHNNSSNNEDDEIHFDLDTSSRTVKTQPPEVKPINDIMPGDKIARGDNARLVLDFKLTRNEYLNDLYELEAFFIQRSSETKTENHMTNFSADESKRGPQYEQSEILEMLAKIQHIISIMNDEKNKTLFQMRDSPNYVERVAERLNNKRNQAEKSLQKAKLCDDRIEECVSQMKELEIQLKKTIEKSKEIQKQIESSISKLYRDRPVNIMGGIS